MTNKEQLIGMLGGCGVGWFEYQADDDDRKTRHNMSRWATSIVFSSEDESGNYLTAFDFDEGGKLLYASSFEDHDDELCPDCRAKVQLEQEVARN